MAVAHIAYNKSTERGAALNGILQSLKAVKDNLKHEFAVMVKMVDGDGSAASQFTYATGKYGFTDNASAKAAYDELNSLKTQLVAIEAAIEQAGEKLG